MKFRFNLKQVLGGLVLAGLAACGGGDNEITFAGASKGTLRLAAPAALVFAADTAAAGRYTFKASLTGFADKTAVPGTLASGATITTNFTLR